jgi:hypothetical protein
MHTLGLGLYFFDAVIAGRFAKGGREVGHGRELLNM